MKNFVKTSVFTLCFFMSMMIHAQQMSWIPAKYVGDKTCEDLSDCNANIVCYKLQYEPQKDGYLTSYTTGFMVNCADNVSAVKTNSSCSMTDHSEQIVKCDEHGVIMLHCSGNTGNVKVKKNRPVYLHQICLQFDNNKHEAIIEEAEVIELTTSINGLDNKAYTEFSNYRTFKAVNSQLVCANDEVNLTLDAQLSYGGNVDVQWEPAKETKDGNYVLWQSSNNSSYEQVAEFASKMLVQSKDYKYRYQVALEDYGDHTFMVSYIDDNGESESNEVEVFYKDERFAIELTPNPAVDNVNLYVTSPLQNVECNVTDASGKLIKKLEVPTDEYFNINLNNFAPGVYNVTVLSNKELLTEKLIIVK